MIKHNFDSQWRFSMDSFPEGGWRKMEDSNWRLLDLPHDWSIELNRDAQAPSGTGGGFFPMGRAWYRKTFDVPREWQDQKVLVEFEGVYMNAEVWLNEHFLGRHPYGYTSFIFDLSPYLQIGVKNVLKVFVDNSCQVNSRWYSGSGIYRHVWLITAGRVHLAHWGISVATPQVSIKSAAVQVRARVENELSSAKDVEVRWRIIAPDGSVVGTAAAFSAIEAGDNHEYCQEIQLTDPSLWSPDSPSLYRLESAVHIQKEMVDSESTIFGIRSLLFDAVQGFLLNGQPLKLKGGCVHHDNGVLGSASYDRSEERKVALHKASGFNAIRCAHNPPAPAFLDACDRLGMLVIDEAFDCWRDGKNPGDYHVAFDDWWQRDLKSMIERDRNHPCVILWSIGNELIERAREEGPVIAQMLADQVHAIDPTRPVTSAVCGSWDGGEWVQTDPMFAVLDVGGYNYQLKQYRVDHERYPHRVMIGTESIPGEAFDNWMSVLELNYVLGDFVWTSLDYLGESGIGRVHFGGDKEPGLGEYPWHQANCGDLDLCGFKRPQSYYRDMLWGNGDKLHIAVHTPIPEGKTPKITYWGWADVSPSWTWGGYEGKLFNVDVYSACERVELFQNGKSLGAKLAGRSERYMAAFEVSYQPGEIKAVGWVGDQVAAEWSIQTAGTPQTMRLTPDRPMINAQPGDLCFFTVEVVDSRGVVDPNLDPDLYFTIKGEGSILAVGSANPVSTEPYTGNRHKAYRGRCLVVVKSNGKPGEIRLRATADGLDGAEVMITAR